jgi:hypothetical protein
MFDGEHEDPDRWNFKILTKILIKQRIFITINGSLHFLMRSFFDIKDFFDVVTELFTINVDFAVT